jgi:hypothetical protein
MGACIAKIRGDELRGERTQKEMSLGEMEQGNKDSEPDPYLEGVREYPAYIYTSTTNVTWLYLYTYT